MTVPVDTVPSEVVADTERAPQQTTAGGADKLLEHQKRFLLDQVLEATPNHRILKGEANRKIGSHAEKLLQLTTETANRLRDELVAQGHLRHEKEGQKVFFVLTDQGREFLQTLEPYPFAKKAPFVSEPVSEEVSRYRTSYLLLQLFEAPKKCLRQGEANARLRGIGSLLELSPRLANHLRQELATKGLITIERHGTSILYRLSQRGSEVLAHEGNFPEMPARTRLSLDGRVLTELLDLLRNGPQIPTAAMKKSEEELAATGFQQFQELLREKYSHTGMVPIWEIRQRIAMQLGDECARHEVLDEALERLRREGKVGMVALTDLRQATQEQLNDSLPGVNETLFYLEPARGQA